MPKRYQGTARDEFAGISDATSSWASEEIYEGCSAGWNPLSWREELCSNATRGLNVEVQVVVFVFGPATHALDG